MGSKLPKTSKHQNLAAFGKWCGKDNGNFRALGTGFHWTMTSKGRGYLYWIILVVILLLTGSWSIKHISCWLYGETFCFVGEANWRKVSNGHGPEGEESHGMFLPLLQKACHYCDWNNRKWMLINCQCWGGAPVVVKVGPIFWITSQLLKSSMSRLFRSPNIPDIQIFKNLGSIPCVLADSAWR